MYFHATLPKACEKDGLDGLIPKFNGGKPSKLSDENKVQFKQILIETENVTMTDAQRILKDDFGIEFSLPHVCNIVSQLGFNYGKPRPKFREAPENGIEKESSVSKLLKVISELEKAGIETSKLPHHSKLLKDLKLKTSNGKEIDIAKILEEKGLDGKYNIGSQISSTLQAAKGNVRNKIEPEEIKELIRYGLITEKEIEDAINGIEKESSVSKLLKVISELEKAGIETSITAE